jgi:hypothetical protein
MSSSPEQLHKHIERLQALLAAAATSSNHYGPSAIGNYELRSCLRQIQVTLMRPDFEFFGHQHQHQHQKMVQHHRHDDGGAAIITYSHEDTPLVGAVDDLVTLLTLNEYEHQQQDGGMELLDGLVPRAAQLIMGSQLSLTNDHLQLLLPRVLSLVSDNNNNATTSSARFEILLGLLNQHLTVVRLEEVLEEDQDIWIALKLLLPTLLNRPRRPPRGFRSLRFISSSEEEEEEAEADSSSIEPDLHVLAGMLLQHWKIRITESESSLDEWLRCHLTALQEEEEEDVVGEESYSFSQQQQNQYQQSARDNTIITRRDYTLPEDLERHVDECMAMVERYGADLLETALQLLEEGAHSPDPGQHHDEEENSAGLLTALKYSTLATDWVEFIGEYFPSISNLSRSLWRALETFIVERLEDDCCGANNNNTPEEVVFDDDIQMGATDSLWRLTQIQLGCMQEQDVSTVVVAMFRLWRHPNYYWTPTTQEWVQSHLLSPKNCKYSTLIRRALQVGLLSMASFPEQYANPEDSLILSNVAQLVLTDESDTNDPWHSMVYEQLADYSVQMEQEMRQM